MPLHAVHGRVIWVDLSSGAWRYQEVPESVYRQVLSGYGLGAYLLYPEIPPAADPLGPDNVLGFCTGLLTNTGAPYAGRFMVVGKSPLTGGWGDANCGGDFGPALKRCGVDALFVRGLARKPVYLLVTEDGVQIRDATGLWGRDTVETEDALREELGDGSARVACIGPGGEHMVRFAGIVNARGRIAARSGLGAVMGSKRLKAVVAMPVQAQDPPVADKASITRVRKALAAEVTSPPSAFTNLLMRFTHTVFRLVGRIPLSMRGENENYRSMARKYGTSGWLTFSTESGDAPVRNWAGVAWDDFPLERAARIGDQAVVRYQARRYHCAGCPLGCGGIMQADLGPDVPRETHKPEYETLAGFGPLLLNHDLESILYLSDLCNRAGLDSISTSSAVAFAFECFARDVLTEDQVGRRLRWGDRDDIVWLTEQIIRRQGIGDLLAEGVKRAAEALRGADSPDPSEWAIHAGGQELPYHDPRYDPTMGLAYAVEPTPGRHTIASQAYWSLMHLDERFSDFPKPPAVAPRSQRYSPEGKGCLQALNSVYTQLINGAGLCLLGVLSHDYPLFELINAATGWKLTEADFRAIGERVETLRHCFNLRAGLRPREVKVAGRALGHPPLKAGPLRRVSLDLEPMIRDFYAFFDWDPETGRPSRERLEALGLSQVIEDLYA